MGRGLTQDQRTQALLIAPLPLLIIRLSLPTMLLMLLQIGMSVVELALIGSLGIQYIAGVSLVYPFFLLVSTLSSAGFGSIISAFIARRVGGPEAFDVSQFIFPVLCLSVFLGLSTTLAFHMIGPMLFDVMAQDAETSDIALSYAQVAFGGAAFIWAFNGLAAVHRGIGDMASPARFALFAAPIAVAIMPLLILDLLPMFDLGVIGGILVILAYYFVGTLFFLGRLLSGCSTTEVRKPQGYGNAELLKTILVAGSVSSSIILLLNLSTISVTGIVGASFSASTLAGYGVASRLDLMLLPVFFGIGASATTLVAANIGSGNPRRAVQAIWIAALFAFGIASIIGIVVSVFPNAWLTFFSDDDQLVMPTKIYLQTVGPFYGFLGVATVLFFASQGTGSMRWAMAGGALRLTVAAGGALAAIAAGFSFQLIAICVAASFVVMAVVTSIPFWSLTKFAQS